MSRASLLLSTLAGVLVIALWWLFLYSPGQDELERIGTEIEAAEAEAASLRGTIARLEAVRAAAPETEAAIASLSGILPRDPALPGALRQLVAAAEDSGVEITALSTSRPSAVEEGGDLYSIATTMTLSGSYFQTVDFLRRLEDPQVTARGFVFDNLSVAPAEYPTLTGSLTGRMFAVLDEPPVTEDDSAAGGADEAENAASDDDAADGADDEEAGGES